MAAKAPPQFGKPKFAAVAIVIRDGYVLSVTRRGMPGDWALPGGKRDKKESLKRCAARELREETGVIADLKSMELVFVGYDTHNNEVYAFLVHKWTETLFKREEGIHVAWARPSRLIERTCTFHDFNRVVLVEKLKMAA